jgi:hypothetical protein
LLKVYSGQRLYNNNFSNSSSFGNIINILKENGYSEATIKDLEEFGL